ncbi:hypothetical protein ACOMHN_042175 [Nucella lapillus]
MPLKDLDINLSSWESLALDHSNWRRKLTTGARAAETRRTVEAQRKRAARKQILQNKVSVLVVPYLSCLAEIFVLDLLFTGKEGYVCNTLHCVVDLGTRHKGKECPAFGSTCNYCHKDNHWAKVCFAKRQQESQKGRKIHSIKEEEDNENEFYVSAITNNKETPNTVSADIELETGNVLRFKIDTGAQVNVIPTTIFEKLPHRPAITPCKEKLISYTGQALKVAGCVNLHVSHKDNTYQGPFYIADTPSQPVLGLQASLQLQLIKIIMSVESTLVTKDEILKDFSKIFTGLGALEGEINIHLKEEAIPVVHAPRRIPHTLKEKLKNDFSKIEKSGVITKVTEPTEWVNSLVIVEKSNGKLRICLDPKDLNTAIRRPHYPSSTLEDALAKLRGAKYFSKLDAQYGYWQLKLNEKSSYLTNFNTRFGRYRFQRLPFGIISAQDEFQRKMDEVFEGLPCVTPLVDDVIISGNTIEEHNANLRAALQRAEERNLKLNPEKLEVGKTEIKYFGHMISADGLKPDPSKVKAVREMPPPANEKELQTMLGMINYLAKFAPQLSEITKPMRDLLKDDVEFIWDKPQEEALNKAKAAILSQPVLILRPVQTNNIASGCQQIWAWCCFDPRRQTHRFCIQIAQSN